MIPLPRQSSVRAHIALSSITHAPSLPPNGCLTAQAARRDHQRQLVGRRLKIHADLARRVATTVCRITWSPAVRLTSASPSPRTCTSAIMRTPRVSPDSGSVSRTSSSVCTQTREHVGRTHHGDLRTRRGSDQRESADVRAGRRRGLARQGRRNRPTGRNARLLREACPAQARPPSGKRSTIAVRPARDIR